MRLLFLGTIVLFAGIATASENDVEDGIAAAERVCAKQFLPSDLRECLKIVSDAKYFEVDAVAVCDRVFLPSDSRKCLASIKNKVYRPAVLEACGKVFLPSDQIACLAENGRPWTPPSVDIDVEEVKFSVKKALRYLRAHELRKAEATLVDLLRELDPKDDPNP